MSWIPQTILSGALEKKKQVLLFTACQSGAGATHAIIECARELEQQYACIRILLADFRLENRTLSEKSLPAPGWQQSLKNNTAILDNVSTLQNNKNISVVVSDGNTSKLCNIVEAGAAFEKLLLEANGRFDLVMADIPPVLPKNGGVLFCQKGDGIILVVEAGKSRKPVIKEAVSEVERMGGNMLGFLLNRRKKLIPQWIYQRFF